MSRLESIVRGAFAGLHSFINPIGYELSRNPTRRRRHRGCRTLGKIVGGIAGILGITYVGRKIASTVAPYVPGFVQNGLSSLYTYAGKGIGYLGFTNPYATTAAASTAAAGFAAVLGIWAVLGTLSIIRKIGTYHGQYNTQPYATNAASTAAT